MSDKSLRFLFQNPSWCGSEVGRGFDGGGRGVEGPAEFEFEWSKFLTAFKRACLAASSIRFAVSSEPEVGWSIVKELFCFRRRLLLRSRSRSASSSSSNGGGEKSCCGKDEDEGVCGVGYESRVGKLPGNCLRVVDRNVSSPSRCDGEGIIGLPSEGPVGDRENPAIP